jgi:CRISPR-associated endonuclease/helicase Cas3
VENILEIESKYYAHSLEGKPPEEWQPLEDHLQNVAEKAGKFAAVFDARQWGHCAGMLHDAGKASDAFQRRIQGSTERVDHSTFGAKLAKENTGKLGLLLSYAIAGHHGGIPDGGEQATQLHFRLKRENLPEAEVPAGISPCQEMLKLPFKLTKGMGGFSLSLFTRMLFSCLVDADFLDTEKFCAPDVACERPHSQYDKKIQDFHYKMETHMDHIVRKAEPSKVNRLRRKILEQCRQKAALPRQVFSLTVPTGGGKTLSSMSFAMAHAVVHGLDRVIYAIPFTSIIEQNAGVFQGIFGRDHVLEHHCNYMEKDDPEEATYNRRRGLAAENWDSPIVVTTNVQFFESLFSNKPSRCRKLHNIANSIIVLDEAQAIPTDYMEPCLSVIQELVDHYRCTIVLCTATQPALDDKSSLRSALPQINEIIDEPKRFFSELKRTNVCFVGKKTDADLAKRIDGENQALCIAATKPQARLIFSLLEKEEGAFHLSTNMYPQHRRRVLEEIRARLKHKKTCRVISTSLVEAGVDLDFPVVFRAMAGLDAIAQAAGRCNREGKLDAGQVYVYEPEKQPRMPWLNRCVSRAAETLRCIPDDDPIGLQAMRRYFELLYDVQELDKKRIMPLMNPKVLGRDLLFPFKEASRAFRFIEEDTVGVIIPRESEAMELVKRLHYTEFPRALLRKLQPYSVAVRPNEYAQLESSGALEICHGEIPILQNRAAYKDDVGLVVDESVIWEASDLIC